MKIPIAPPQVSLDDILGKPFDMHRVHRMYQSVVGPEVDGVYEHWDRIRHLPPPPNHDSEAWWWRIKQAREAIARKLPLRDKSGHPFVVSLTDSMQRRLHFIDREAAGTIKGLDRAENPEGVHSYLMRSLIEEAMTSSQLEGASTTRQVAKDMLRSGRRPRDRSEQMIFNNFAAMQELQRWRDQPLDVAAILEMHRMLTIDAMDDPSASGRFRRSDEPIEIMDPYGRVLHVPPPAHEIAERTARLCAFANDTNSPGFLHPVVRAIALHFQLGYDHPFVDGNGRVARALFYWSMLRSGYWLTEYLSISSVLKKAPGQYSRAFLYTETDDSDLSYFVDHQLSVIEKSVEGLRDYLARKSRERHQAERLLRPNSELGRRLNHRQRELLLQALREPDSLFRIASHQRTYGVAYQTARSDLQELVELRLFDQSKQGSAFVFFPVGDLQRRLEG